MATGQSACRGVDTNVLLDILTDDPTWADWSGSALAEARDAGNLVINPIVYAEVSVRFDRIEERDEALPAGDFLREELSCLAGFLAGRAYARYRRREAFAAGRSLHRRARGRVPVQPADP